MPNDFSPAPLGKNCPAPPGFSDFNQAIRRIYFSTMQAIPLDLAKPGMTLARDVANAIGIVLVPAGATLTDAHLERLAKMEVASIIVSESVDIPGKVRLTPEQRLERLTDRFSRVNDRPEMAKIHDAFRRLFDGSLKRSIEIAVTTPSELSPSPELTEENHEPLKP